MVIKVRVKTGARRESVKRLDAGRFEISGKEKAERGEANRRVIAILALELKVLTKNIRIIIGARSPSKTLEIREK